jgi:hypothetical protein
MTTFEAVENMRTEAIEMTQMGNFFAVVWEKIDDIVIEVFADAVEVEYVAKADDDIFVTTNISEFVEAIEYAMDF